MNTHDLRGAQLIEQLWPVDGPHTAESIATAAAAMAELTRYLARATRSARAMSEPDDGYSVVGGLCLAAVRFGQVTRQLAQWAEGFADDERLRGDAHETHADAAQLAAIAGEHLRAAGYATHRVAAALGLAHGDLGQLYRADAADSDENL